MLKKIKKAFVTRASNSTFHGLHSLVNSEYVLLNIVWFVTISASYSYCASVIIRSFDEYYNYPVITNINRVFDREPEFPMITFCNAKEYSCEFNNKTCQNLNMNRGCVEFNSGKNGTDHEFPILKSKKPGRKYGLTLNMTSDTNKVLIFIHNQSVELNPDKGIQISVGMETFLVISRIFETKLSSPYSYCKADYSFKLGADDNFNRTLYPYFQLECFNLCDFQKFFEAINKSEEYFKNFQYYFTNYNKWNMTTFRSYLNYSYLYRDAFGKVTNLTKLLGHNKFCEDICPNECNQISYTVTSYYAINYQSHAMVNIYYEDFTFTEISQIPKITSDSLFAMFGNIFGKIICSWFYSQIYSFLYIKAVLVDCF